MDINNLWSGYDLNMETKIAVKEYFPVELVSCGTTTIHGDRVLSLSGEKSATYKAARKKYVAGAQNVNVSANTAATLLKGLAVKKEDRIQNVHELIAVLYEGVKVTAGKNPKKRGRTASGSVSVTGNAGVGNNRAGTSGMKIGLIGAAVAVVVLVGVMMTNGNAEQPPLLKTLHPGLVLSIWTSMVGSVALPHMASRQTEPQLTKIQNK